jgi:predicted DCC family thiol-disulfide oxidoreductase YuxK
VRAKSHPPEQNSGRLLVFYDGTCGLCHRLVRFVLRRDAGGVVRFAQLQGKSFQKLIADYPWLQEISSIVVVDLAHPEQDPLVRGQAVARILKALPGWRWLGRMLDLPPRKLWDWLYERTASKRYLFFGRSASCDLLRPEERNRFLDLEEGEDFPAQPIQKPKQAPLPEIKG